MLNPFYFHSSLEAAEFSTLAGDKGHLYLCGLLVFPCFQLQVSVCGSLRVLSFVL